MFDALDGIAKFIGYAVIVVGMIWFILRLRDDNKRSEIISCDDEMARLKEVDPLAYQVQISRQLAAEAQISQRNNEIDSHRFPLDEDIVKKYRE